MGLEQESRYMTIEKLNSRIFKKQFFNLNPDDINLSILSKSRQLCNIYIPKEDTDLNQSLDSSMEEDDDSIIRKNTMIFRDKFINETNM